MGKHRAIKFEVKKAVETDGKPSLTERIKVLIAIGKVKYYSSLSEFKNRK